MAKKISILLGWPDKKLSPNYGNKYHYMKIRLRAEARAKAIEDARWCVTEEWQPFDGQGRMTIIVHPPDRRRRDLDNLLAMMKQSIDGVCEVLGLDDHQLHPVTIDYGEPDPETPHIEVEIEDMEVPDRFFGGSKVREPASRDEMKVARLENLESVILTTLKANGRLVGNEIVRRVGGNRNNILKALRRLHEEGKLMMEPGTGRAKLYRLP